MNNATQSVTTPSSDKQNKTIEEQWIALGMSALILLSQVFHWARKIKRSKCWGVELDLRSQGSSSSSEEEATTPREGAIHLTSA